MSSFKLGDRVKFTNIYGEYPDHKLNNGKMGTVSEYEDDLYDVTFEDGSRSAFIYPEELELIENENFSSEDIQITSETTVTLTILEDEYKLAEEDARYMLQELKKALGEGDE